MTVEWGSGIVGHVAKTGETVSIPDAYKDARFNKEVDEKTGYNTKSVLCMPVMIQRDSKKVIIGVAMAINKAGADGNIVAFSVDDEKVVCLFVCLFVVVLFVFWFGFFCFFLFFWGVFLLCLLFLLLLLLLLLLFCVDIR